MLTAVTYHYVRDPERTPWPGIKARRVSEFEQQLDHLERHYEVCSAEQVRNALGGHDALPERACLLTFDDGLREHHQTVAPRLEERGLPGLFFVTAAAVEEQRVLHVHKLQFALAAVPDPDVLLAEVLAELEESGVMAPDLPERELGRPEFDPPATVYLKRLLQHELPAHVREPLLDRIFARHVTADEAALAGELYCGPDELRELERAGMEVGGHGGSHRWLGHLRPEEQRSEIGRMVRFLDDLRGEPPVQWALSYPGGSYDERTIELLADAGCALGFTVRLAVADDLSRPLELPRLDTNDIPLEAAAAPVTRP